ncbi:MAG TPA: non-homologous end-joining DNA ligase [Acidimicrobiales bacterium]|nr:non-homologous end-joining DNA ligase [Acidimicrobiales bacterium]
MTTPMPAGVRPMLATIGEMPGEAGWSYEVKWDGVRSLAYVRGSSIKLESRNLKDFTPRYPEIVGEGAVPAALANHEVVLDGEIVGFDERGRVSFGALQHRMHLTSAADVRSRVASHPVAYMLFDVLWLDGEDLTSLAYEDRRARLEGLELTGGLWQVPPAVWDDPEDGADLLEASRIQGLEGIVAKRLGSKYEPGKRARTWKKVKNKQRQELVIGGWLPGEGNRFNSLGAILVGYHQPGLGLHYAGRVGTGFTFKVLRELLDQLEPLGREDSPFADNPRLPGARWVEPRLVAEVGFSEWTSTGTLRHPVYFGLRDDKDPGQVVREPVMGEN